MTKVYDYERVDSSMTKSLQFWISRVNNDPCINILDKVDSIITQNSNTFTELEYCRHEYLRLWMSYVFNDKKFTILNEWSQQCSHHQDCLRKEPIIAQDSIILIELEDYRSKYLRLCLSGVFSMTTRLPFWMSGVNNDPSIKIVYRMEPKTLKFYNIDSVKRLQGRISTIMNEWCLQWPQVYNFELVESTIKPVSTFLIEWSN